MATEKRILLGFVGFRKKFSLKPPIKYKLKTTKNIYFILYIPQTTHLVTHSHTYSVNQLITHLVTYSLNQSLTHLVTQSFIHSLSHSHT